MKKMYLLIMLMVILSLTGCAKAADEEQMRLDLEADAQFGVAKEGEEIQEIVIEKRQTDKKQKEDTVWCTIKTAKEGILYQKQVILTYGLYDKGWMLDDLMVNDPSQWILTPLEGINEDNVAVSLYGKSVTIDGEEWNITNGQIKNISVSKHETDLANEKDVVTAEVTIEEEVEEAKGELTIEYLFGRGWIINSISVNKDFVTSIKPESALDVTDEDLIAQVSGQSFVLREPDTSYIWTLEETMHTVTINSNEISYFTIDNQESLSKGTKQIYHCQCSLIKPHVTFKLEIEIPYRYDSGEWDLQSITITPQCEKLDIVGEWTGTYTDTPFGGKAVLNITSADENGFITAVYSYYPEERDKYTAPGSYSVSGTINMSTLDMNLIAGDWIEEPSRIRIWNEKLDVVATLCVDEAAVKGTGQGSNPFVVSLDN
ncbi:MAG: hypothetical protein NC429_11355 [Lachnospiraceae bacterium]|nr:hypothetical protein [Lachnospiraceae bacterium]